MQYCNGAFGFEAFALVSHLRFINIELFSTSFEVVLLYDSKSRFVTETEHDKPTVAVDSAFLKHASRVDVIKDHGYSCAAICNGSEVRV